MAKTPRPQHWQGRSNAQNLRGRQLPIDQRLGRATGAAERDRKNCQVWVVSHASRLIATLEQDPECNAIELELGFSHADQVHHGKGQVAFGAVKAVAGFVGGDGGAVGANSFAKRPIDSIETSRL
jgi:hypothetical protein